MKYKTQYKNIFAYDYDEKKIIVFCSLKRFLELFNGTIREEELLFIEAPKSVFLNLRGEIHD